MFCTRLTRGAVNTYVGFHAALPVEHIVVIFEAGDESLCRRDGGMGR